MISGDDIEAMCMGYYEPYTAKDYSAWVEDKILTTGDARLVENVLGLVGEAGEVAEKIKKMIRDDTDILGKEIAKELGDVVFYTTALANFFGESLQSVLDMNVDKLDGREERGTLRGSGDNR